MSQLELLKFVLAILERLQIPAMLVGSHASSFYGEARTTHDVDLLVSLERRRIPDLIAAFAPERHYVSDRALYEGRVANIIDIQTGDKLDLFLSQNSPRDVAAMKRRRNDNPKTSRGCSDASGTRSTSTTSAANSPWRVLATAGRRSRNSYEQTEIRREARDEDPL